MPEPTTLQPGLPSEALPAPSKRPGVPCERCGTFIQRVSQEVGGRQVCEACAALLHKDLRLYPTWYVYLLGILGNFCFAGFLSAINWKRLGDKPRRRNALIVAVLGVVWTLLAVQLQSRGVGLLIINFIGTRVAAQALNSAYEQHERAGGARANLLWPVVIILGALIVLMTIDGAILILTGRL